jgi:phosphoribosyl-ATP pyrophosphohydrolase
MARRAAPQKSNHIDVLDRLFEVIESRRGSAPSTSYTASLFAGGTEHIARKLGEESVETMVAGLIENKDRLVSESADLIYHLFVLLAARKLRPDHIWAELVRREGTSGHAEKAARPKVKSPQRHRGSEKKVRKKKI